MRRKLTCWELLALSGLIVLTGLGSSAAGAQTSLHTQTARPASATSGSGDYYVEFRSRRKDFAIVSGMCAKYGLDPKNSS